MGTVSLIHVVDTGPGVPDRARQNLFRAFQGSVRAGGIGLGLAIAHELVSAHGGTLKLEESASGAHFSIEIPDRTVSLNEARQTKPLIRQSS
jgi:signal transduction histidine kinase